VYRKKKRGATRGEEYHENLKNLCEKGGGYRYNKTRSTKQRERKSPYFYCKKKKVKERGRGHGGSCSKGKVTLGIPGVDGGIEGLF